MIPSQAEATENSVRHNPVRSSRASYDWLLLSALLIIATVLRFLFLAKKSFWFDEGVSVEIVRLDWYNFARILWRREANMFLYYLLLRGWLHFGHSEFFVRGLSLLPALATLLVLYWLGRRLFDRRVGLIAAVLLTFNAYHIRYSQEARSYSLLILLATLSSTFFLDYLLRPSPRNRLGHIVTSGLALYAQFYAGLLIVAQWLSLSFLERDQIPPDTNKNWRWIGILVFPALAFAGTTGVGPLSWIKRPGLKELYDYYDHMAGNGGLFLVLGYLLACGAALAPFAGQLFRRRLPWDTWRYQFLLLWLLFPVLFTLAVSMVRPMFVARYFILCLPAFLLLAAAGLIRLPRKWLLASALLFFFALSLKGTLSYYTQDFDLGRDDWRAATYYILNQARRGDVIIFHIALGRMPYEYYKSIYPGDARGPMVVYPAHGDRLDYRDFLGEPSKDFLQSIPEKYDRVWVVLKNNGTRASPDPTTQVLNLLFGRSYPHVEETQFPWVEVRLYSK